MRVLFIHDHRLRKVNDVYYTTGGFSDSITKRYTDIFESMTLLCRASYNNNIKGCSKIENSKVSICPIFENKLLPKKKIVRILQKEIDKNDRIIIRLPSLLGIYAGLIALKKRKKVYIEVVGSALGSYWYRNLFGKIVAYPLEIFNKKLIKKADYVSYVSEDYLQHEYPNNNHTLGCSDVLLEERNITVLNKRITKIKKCLIKKKLVLGTLSQIDQKYKGHKTVFKAISALKKQGLFIEYRLAGNGKKSYLLSLARKYDIEDNIVFCGQINHKDINNWLDDLDIYIQPSLTEGMPRSVIEAIYRACPTIVSNAGGMYELIEEKYTFKKGNISELITILSEIDIEKLENMAKRNFEFSSKFEEKNLTQKRNNFLLEFKRSA